MYFHLVLTDLQFLPMLRNKSHQPIVSLKVLYFNRLFFLHSGINVGIWKNFGSEENASLSCLLKYHLVKVMRCLSDLNAFWRQKQGKSSYLILHHYHCSLCCQYSFSAGSKLAVWNICKWKLLHPTFQILQAECVSLTLQRLTFG